MATYWWNDCFYDRDHNHQITTDQKYIRAAIPIRFSPHYTPNDKILDFYKEHWNDWCRDTYIERQRIEVIFSNLQLRISQALALVRHFTPSALPLSHTYSLSLSLSLFYCQHTTPGDLNDPALTPQIPPDEGVDKSSDDRF